MNAGSATSFSVTDAAAPIADHRTRFEATEEALASGRVWLVEKHVAFQVPSVLRPPTWLPFERLLSECLGLGYLPPVAEDKCLSAEKPRAPGGMDRMLDVAESKGVFSRLAGRV